MGLGLADGFRLQAGTASRTSSRGKNGSHPATAALAPKAASCILVWLDGGPSHYETFDPKPDAPSDIRGNFKDIATAVPGIRFSEAVPDLAKVADKATIIRSICHKDPNHGGGNHYLMTGCPTPCPWRAGPS